MALDAARGLADHRRPQLRRPRPVAARQGRVRLLGRRPDASDHRPDRVGRRHRRLVHRGRQAAAARRGDARGQDRPRGRPGVARRRTGAGRGHPRTPRRPADRGGGPQHQPARGPDAEPARALLPADRQRAVADDRVRQLPVPGRALRPRRLPTGGRRVHPRRRVGARHLRQPERALGLPQARADRRPQRQVARRDHPRAGPGHDATGRGDHQRGARWPDAARHRAGQRPGDGDPAVDPVAPGRRAHRRAGAAPRRDRAAPSRPRAGHQGRDHPRDPPPGEEQPADRGGAAAAAGAAARHPGGPGRARGGRTTGRGDRGRPRDPEPDLRRDRRLRRGDRPADPAGHRRGVAAGRRS